MATRRDCHVRQDDDNVGDEDDGNSSGSAGTSAGDTSFGKTASDIAGSVGSGVADVVDAAITFARGLFGG